MQPADATAGDDADDGNDEAPEEPNAEPESPAVEPTIISEATDERSTENNAEPGPPAVATVPLGWINGLQTVTYPMTIGSRRHFKAIVFDDQVAVWVTFTSASIPSCLS